MLIAAVYASQFCPATCCTPSKPTLPVTPIRTHPSLRILPLTPCCHSPIPLLFPIRNAGQGTRRAVCSVEGGLGRPGVPHGAAAPAQGLRRRSYTAVAVRAPDGNVRRSKDLAQARRLGPHGRTQDQQRPWPGEGQEMQGNVLVRDAIFMGGY